MKNGILLSGGVDSICLTYGINPQIAYTIDYGQNVADREIYVSKYICQELKIEHKIIRIDCSSLGVGALINSENLDFAPSSEWWPYRNQLLITLALMQGIKDEINNLYIASVKSDEFHKDGTSEFYTLINKLIIYQEKQISIICPTTQFYSHELVTKFNVPLNLVTMAHSCHRSNIACGYCSGCLKQLRVKHELNIG